MDISIILGLVIGFGALLMGFVLEGGEIGSLFLLSPFIIVFGGTMGAVVLSFKTSDILSAVKSLMRSFSRKSQGDPTMIITEIAKMADACRQGGFLKLQEMLNFPFLNEDNYIILKEGMMLILDMKNADEVRYTLESNIATYTAQKQMEISVLTGAAGFSPTLGVIGTVMGLIHVLSDMSDAASLTAAIGAAFIATLYGVGFANLVYLPFANRLKSTLKRHQILCEMMTEGICMVARGENSRSVESRLAVYYQAFPKGNVKFREGIEK